MRKHLQVIQPLDPLAYSFSSTNPCPCCHGRVNSLGKELVPYQILDCRELPALYHPLEIVQQVPNKNLYVKPKKVAKKVSSKLQFFVHVMVLVICWKLFP